MQSLFEKNVNSKRHKDELKVPIRNSVTFGEKSVRVLGPHVKFKTQVNNWFGPKCNCSACKYVGN